MGDGYIYTDVIPEDAVLVGVITGDQTEDMAKEYIDELAFLAETSGAVTKKKFLQRLSYPNPQTFVGGSL